MWGSLVRVAIVSAVLTSCLNATQEPVKARLVVLDSRCFSALVPFLCAICKTNKIGINILNQLM